MQPDEEERKAKREFYEHRMAEIDALDISSPCSPEKRDYALRLLSNISRQKAQEKKSLINCVDSSRYQLQYQTKHVIASSVFNLAEDYQQPICVSSAEKIQEMQNKIDLPAAAFNESSVNENAVGEQVKNVSQKEEISQQLVPLIEPQHATSKTTPNMTPPNIFFNLTNGENPNQSTKSIFFDNGSSIGFGPSNLEVKSSHNAKNFFHSQPESKTIQNLESNQTKQFNIFNKNTPLNELFKVKDQKINKKEEINEIKLFPSLNNNIFTKKETDQKQNQQIELKASISPIPKAPFFIPTNSGSIFSPPKFSNNTDKTQKMSQEPTKPTIFLKKVEDKTQSGQLLFPPLNLLTSQGNLFSKGGSNIFGSTQTPVMFPVKTQIKEPIVRQPIAIEPVVVQPVVIEKDFIKPTVQDIVTPKVQTSAPLSFLSSMSVTNNTNIFNNKHQKDVLRLFGKTNQSKNPPTSNIFQGQNLFAKNSTSENKPTANLFSMSTNPSNSNNLFGTTTGNNIFSNNSQPSGQSLFSSKQPNAENEEQDENGEEDDNEPLAAQDDANPNESKGTYEHYLENQVLFKQNAIKFKHGAKDIVENVTFSVVKFPDKPEKYVYVRLANKRIVFSGRVIEKTTQLNILHNNSKNVEVKKILCIDNPQKLELALLKVQFKDEKIGNALIELLSKKQQNEKTTV